MRAIKNIRLPRFDYRSNGYYFVTVVSDERRRIFVDEALAVIDENVMRMNEWPGVKVDYRVIMANHVHMILVFDRCSLTLGEVVRRFKAKCSRALGRRLWQPNYYEHVIRTDEALNAIREYIQNNPLAEKLEFKAFYENRPMNRATTGNAGIM